MSLNKKMVWAFAIASNALSPAFAISPNESAVNDLRAFLKVPNGPEHYRATFNGLDGVNHKPCVILVEADPGIIRVKIRKDNAPVLLPPAIAEITATGMNSSGDRIDVTKVARFPNSLLVTVYYERRTGAREKGDMTLLLEKHGEGPVLSFSISDGEGIINCTRTGRFRLELDPSSEEALSQAAVGFRASGDSTFANQ